jgi:hypothetical protein
MNRVAANLPARLSSSSAQDAIGELAEALEERSRER